MARQFRLSSLLNWVALGCVLLWVYPLEGGGEILGIIAYPVALWAVLYTSLHVCSFILGTPGERQHIRGQHHRKTARSPLQVPVSVIADHRPVC